MHYLLGVLSTSYDMSLSLVCTMQSLNQWNKFCFCILFFFLENASLIDQGSPVVPVTNTVGCPGFTSYVWNAALFLHVYRAIP